MKTRYPDLASAIDALEKIRLDPATSPERRAKCAEAVEKACQAIEAKCRARPEFHATFAIPRVAGSLPGDCELFSEEIGKPQFGAELATAAATALLDALYEINKPGPGESYTRLERNKDGQIIGMRQSGLPVDKEAVRKIQELTTKGM